jgi:guanylate kinase
MLFVISGPSGSGKSTLIRRVRETLDGLAFSVSHTTRKPRPSERPGVDYHFVALPVFERMVRDGKFVEWAEVHGHLYGTSRVEVERKGARRDLLLDIDVQGAAQVRAKIPKAVEIFIMPPLFADLRRRLEKRGEDDPEAVAKRLRDAGREVCAYGAFDYVVVNDDLEKAVGELAAIIVAARCRTSAREGEIGRILRSFRRRGAPGRKAGRAAGKVRP